MSLKADLMIINFSYNDDIVDLKEHLPKLININKKIGTSIKNDIYLHKNFYDKL